MKHILILTFTYSPNADGIATAAVVLAQSLARSGYQVTIATEFHPERQPDAADANPQVVQFKLAGSANWRLGVKGSSDEIMAYQKFLCDFSGDLMIFENWHFWTTCLAEPVLKRIKAKKILVSHAYTPHMWIPQAAFPWGLGVWLGGLPLFFRTPFLMRRFDQLVFLSQRQDFGRFLDHRLARWSSFKKFSVIPNGAFSHEFNDASLPDFRQEFNLGSGLLVLCVANYFENKGQLLAGRAFRQARLKDAILVFIGSQFNGYSEQVRRQDMELQKDFPAGRVILLHKLSRAQTCAAYKAADLFVLPSQAETQPIVLLEAMASRTPWLSTNTGCVSELPGGIVIHSEADLVEKLRKLVAKPELRKQLAEEGWLASQKTYDWERVTDAYAKLVRQLLDQKEDGH